MTFIAADETTQYAYSETRNAIAEYWRGQNRWILAGWLWDGEVRSLADARAKLATIA